jgi:hypothetical protein
VQPDDDYLHWLKHFAILNLFRIHVLFDGLDVSFILILCIVCVLFCVLFVLFCVLFVCNSVFCLCVILCFICVILHFVCV